MLIEANPQTPPSELVNVIKTQTSRKVRKLYGDTLLKKYYWKPYFWSDSYFIATVSENTLADMIDNKGKQEKTLRQGYNKTQPFTHAYASIIDVVFWLI